MWATYNLNSNSHFGLGGEAWSMSSLLHVQPGTVTETMVLFAFLRRERYCHLNDSSKRHQAKASWTKTDWTEITSSPLHEVSDIDQGKESEHIPSFNDAYQLIKEYWAGARGVSSLVLYSLGQFISSSMISSSAFMSESKVFLFIVSLSILPIYYLKMDTYLLMILASIFHHNLRKNPFLE